MSFLWPVMLLAVASLPLAVLAYRAIGRHRRRRLAAAGRFATAMPVGTPEVGGVAGTRGGPIRRRLPGALLLVGLALITLALARPHSELGVPRLEGTVILAFDVSGSMAATDLEPTRMEAAKAAAKAFVERQPSTVRIGVVAFSDSGFSVQPPTDDQAEVIAAIGRLGPERATSLGQGIIVALETIQIALEGEDTNFYSDPDAAPTPEPTPVPEGQFAPALIVLLTDGENTTQPDPLAVAQLAADRGVRIDTIGIGSAEGVTLEIEGFRVHTSLDEAALQAISEISGGTYHPAAGQDDLTAIYDGVTTRLVVRTEPLEVTSLFVGAGVLFLLAGAASSLVWLGRLP